MASFPRILQRTKNFVDMSFRNSPDIRAYRVAGAITLDAAFAGTSAMFTVKKGRHYRSPSIVSRRLARVQESMRGLTRATFDPQDFVSATLPPDSDMLFLTVQEETPSGGTRPPGSILIVPAAPFFTSHRPSLTVSGTAPDVSGATNLQPPSGSMHFALPRYADSANITNSGSNDIYVAFSDAQPEIVIPAGENRLLADGVINEVFIRGDGGTSDFSMYFALAIGAHE